MKKHISKINDYNILDDLINQTDQEINQLKKKKNKITSGFEIIKLLSTPKVI